MNIPSLLLLCLGLLVLPSGCGGSTDSQSYRGTSLGSHEEGSNDRRPLRVLEGRASYYADSLAGNHTANGDIYDPAKLTAASRDLAFGTIVRVVRVDTGASVVVRVNDRGPFGDRRRILDLSRAAAERLDMIRAGVITIRAEILEEPR